ncbi:ABC transporter ATP-binding protein [Clostridium massiliamazoniense]|uniref:ABC transporter ATP-binding protein n=1 Tax=Clostridium massiliamazoniense TaxID=1347366 RepID=UPI0006D7703B|nr:ABC transporter ATP-binding protein [Clostridium massiliamazoniense]
MIIFNNLSKAYYGKNYVVTNLNLKINSGEIIGLIGHNGAGKTTTLKMLSGILKPSKGEINVFSKTLSNDNITVKKMINYVPDKPIILLELTGLEYLEFISNIYEVPLEERNTNIALLTKKFKVENVLNDKLKNYSQGMRKKLMLIASFISNAKILVLDEPLTGLDPEAIFILKELLKDYVKKGNIVIFSTHLLDIAESFCTRFFILNKGNIIFDGDIYKLKDKYGEDASLEDVFMEVIKNE